MERSFAKKKLLVGMIAVACAAVLGLGACSPSADEGADAAADSDAAATVQPAGSGNIPTDDKVMAKAVIKGASNVFATTDSLTLTNEDSPATISMGDAQFDQFFQELQAYRDVADLELTECSFDVKIYQVVAETAREDSTQVSYQYSIGSADMVVNGKHITWTKTDGFQED